MDPASVGLANAGGLLGVWFHQHADRVQAEAALRASANFSFLVRCSSQGGYAVSKFSPGWGAEFEHFIVGADDQGFWLQNCPSDQNYYASLPALLETSLELKDYLPVENAEMLELLGIQPGTSVPMQSGPQPVPTKGPGAPAAAAAAAAGGYDGQQQQQQWGSASGGGEEWAGGDGSEEWGAAGGEAEEWGSGEIAAPGAGDDYAAGGEGYGTGSAANSASNSAEWGAASATAGAAVQQQQQQQQPPPPQAAAETVPPPPPPAAEEPLPPPPPGSDIFADMQGELAGWGSPPATAATQQQPPAPAHQPVAAGVQPKAVAPGPPMTRAGGPGVGGGAPKFGGPKPGAKIGAGGPRQPGAKMGMFPKRGMGPGPKRGPGPKAGFGGGPAGPKRGPGAKPGMVRGPSVSALREGLGGMFGGMGGGPPGAAAAGGSSPQGPIAKRPVSMVRPKSEFFEQTVAPDRLLTLVVSANGQSLERQFPPCAPIKFVNDWLCVQTLGYHPGAPEHVNDAQRSYLHQNGAMLDPSKSLEQYPQLKTNPRCEFTAVKRQVRVLKCNVPELQLVVGLRVDEATTGWALVQQVIRKIFGLRQGAWALPSPPHTFGLFFGQTAEMIDEDAVVVPRYEANFATPLAWRVKPAAAENVDFRANVGVAGSFVLVEHDSRSVTADVVRRFTKNYHLATNNIVEFQTQFGLAVPITMGGAGGMDGMGGEDEKLWLEADQPLSQYIQKISAAMQIAEAPLQWGPRWRPYQIIFPPTRVTPEQAAQGVQPTQEKILIAFDSLATVRECFEVVRSNAPAFFGSRGADSYALFLENDSELVLDCALNESVNASGGLGSSPVADGGAGAGGAGVGAAAAGGPPMPGQGAGDDAGPGGYAEAYQPTRLYVKGKKLALHIFVEGLAVDETNPALGTEDGQVSAQVDFSLTLGEVLAQVWQHQLGRRPREERDFASIRALTPDLALTFNKTLFEQQQQQNASIRVKMRQREQIASSLAERFEQDVSIWAEPENEQTVVFETDGKVRGGTLNVLVRRLTSEHSIDMDFMKAFLMTYHSFCKPAELLFKLNQRFYVPIPADLPPEQADAYRKQHAIPVQLRVCNALKYWMDNSWQDFDHELTQEVTTFADNLPVEQDPLFSKLADQIRAAILKRTMGNKGVGARSTTLAFSKLHKVPEPILNVPKKKIEKGVPLNMWDYDELEIARQLTILEFLSYQLIRPQELLDQAWMKAKHRAPNVLAMIQRANDISLWVCGLILKPDRAKVRALRFAKLIRIAKHLRDLNNFSSLMAFLGGFNNSAIFRLKFTKKYIPARDMKTLESLEATMSVEGSFRNYREAVAQATPPLIPYMGTYLSDLTFIDEGNPNMINDPPHELINWGKRMLVWRSCDEISRFQATPYVLATVNQVAMHVRDIPSHDAEYDKILYAESLKVEPRDAVRVP